MLPLCLFVVHDAIRSGKHKMTKLPGWQQVTGPFFYILHLDIKAWGNNTTLVDAALKFYNNLASAVVVDQFELTDVSVFLHALQKFDNDLGDRSEKHLALSALLSVGHRLQGISQHAHAYHDC